MGLIISKALNLHKVTKENEDTTVENNLNGEPKSLGSIENSMVVQKVENDCSGLDNDAISHQQIKSLRNLKSDPRSPTIGIYRTPILVQDSDYENRFHFDSPVSIYSSNVSSVIQDVMTPLEPPVNVSGFDNSIEVEYDLRKRFANPNLIKESEKIVSLRVNDKPSTHEAKKLLQEINLSNENYFKKNCTPSRKNKNKMPKSINDKMPNDLKVNLLKSRTPLSNITSSGNSPGPLVPSAKLFSRSKAVAEFGSENSMSPIGHQLAQWDKNNTVII